MTGQSFNAGGMNEEMAFSSQEHGSLEADSCGCGKSEKGGCGCGAEGKAEGDSCGCGGGGCGCGGAEAEMGHHENKSHHSHAKQETVVVQKKELIEEVNSKRPEVKMDDENAPIDPLFAPYHRTVEEMEAMPIIEKTMTVCPECKLIIPGTIYKDGDNVMIRKFCPDHKWAVEKYWEDYEMYTKMKRYNYFGRGLDNPNYLGQGQNCPFDCGICERH